MVSRNCCGYLKYYTLGIFRDVVLNALLPPHADHNYSQNLENTDSSNQLKSNKSEKEVEQLFPEPEDLRQCIFCSQYGDDMAKVLKRISNPGLC